MGIIRDFINRIKRVFARRPEQVHIEKQPAQPKEEAKPGQKSAPRTIGEAELQSYRRTIRELRKQIEELKEKVSAQKVGPEKAIGGVQVIYTHIKDEAKNIDGEMKKVKSLMDFMERSYLKRKISEQSFRAKMLEYKEKLHLLALEKKELGNQKIDLRSTTKQIPGFSSISLDQIARTQDIEKLLMKQQETLDKLAEREPVVLVQQGRDSQEPDEAESAVPLPKKKQGKKIVPRKTQKKKPIAGKAPTQGKQVFVAQPAIVSQSPRKQVQFVKQQLSSVPDSKKITTFLEHKAEGKIDHQKLVELEAKMGQLMERYSIPEKQIEDSLKDTSTQNLVESINKLLSIIELEKKADSKLKEPERIETAMRFTTPMKQIDEVKGIATEIKKHRIVTDFDRVLMYILENERASFGKISKELGIPGKRVEECCKILKDESQIEVIYPVVGDPIAQKLDYYAGTKKDKKQKR